MMRCKSYGKRRDTVSLGSGPAPDDGDDGLNELQIGSIISYESY